MGNGPESAGEHRQTHANESEKPSASSRCLAGSMHDKVPAWSDPCCSCEPEPYWVEVAGEVENDLDAAPTEKEEP